VRVPGPHDGPLDHENQRKGALQLGQNLGEPLFIITVRCLGQKMDDHLRIHGGLEDRTLIFQLAVKLLGIGEISVMSDRDRFVAVGHEEWLAILDIGRAGRGVTGMGDRDRTLERLQCLAIKDIDDQSFVFDKMHPLPSKVAMPAASSPRCWSAYSPKYASFDASG